MGESIKFYNHVLGMSRCQRTWFHADHFPNSLEICLGLKFGLLRKMQLRSFCGTIESWAVGATTIWNLCQKQPVADVFFAFFRCESAL